MRPLDASAYGFQMRQGRLAGESRLRLLVGHMGL